MIQVDQAGILFEFGMHDRLSVRGLLWGQINRDSAPWPGYSV